MAVTVYNSIIATNVTAGDVAGMTTSTTPASPIYDAAALAGTPSRRVISPANFATVAAAAPAGSLVCYDVEHDAPLGLYMDERYSTRRQVRRTCRHLNAAIAAARAANPTAQHAPYGWQRRDWNAVIFGGTYLTDWQTSQTFAARLLAPASDRAVTDLYLFSSLAAYSAEQLGGYIDAQLDQLRSVAPAGPNASTRPLVYVTPQYHPADPTSPNANVDLGLWQRLNDHLAAAADVDPVLWGITQNNGTQAADYPTWKATPGAAALIAAFRASWSL